MLNSGLRVELPAETAVATGSETAHAPQAVNKEGTVVQTSKITVHSHPHTQLHHQYHISPHVVTTAAGTWEAVPAQALVNTMATVAMTTAITAQPQLKDPSHLGPRVITTVAGTWEAALAGALVNPMATVAMTTTLPACQRLLVYLSDQQAQMGTPVGTTVAAT